MVVSQNYVEAVKWFRLAADQGNGYAQFNLGFMYDKGEGVPQDYAEAVKWYRKAADQGNGAAQVGLGVMYETGRAVPQDYVQAHMWFSLRAASLPAGELQDAALAARDEIASKMTPAQIAEAQKLVREWKPKRER
jgi:uncharacterized protein